MRGALTIWASDWAARLVEQGGAHGQGSSLSIDITSEGFSYLPSDQIDERRAAMNGPGPGGERRRSGRRAITYVADLAGAPALWIDAVQYENGHPEHRAVLAMPFRRSWLGRVRSAGSVQIISATGGEA